jgi:predicted transcriptional regulator
MLQAFQEQASATKETLFSVLHLYDQTKNTLKTELPKTYSADLVDALFSYPVITPTTLSGELQIHRRTAARYLETLKDHGFVIDQLVGRHHLYINQSLIELFSVDSR